MKLPDGEDDGALPLDRVLETLRENGVKAFSVENKTYLSKDKVLEIQYFTDPVRRRVIQYLSRKFEIHIVRFYFPDADESDLRLS